MSTSKKQSEIEKLHTKLAHYKESPLYPYRMENNYFPVLGDGTIDASIVFIGEAPGKKEAETGKPFVGAAGKMLDTLLSSISLMRKDVYITNIVNDRPPNNRDPKPEEVLLYSPILLKLLSIIKPDVLVTLGRFSMSFLLDTYHAAEKHQSISELHGKELTLKTPFGLTVLVPLYHPAYALYNGGMRTVLHNDFQILKKYI